MSREGEESPTRPAPGPCALLCAAHGAPPCGRELGRYPEARGVCGHRGDPSLSRKLSPPQRKSQHPRARPHLTPGCRQREQRQNRQGGSSEAGEKGLRRPERRPAPWRRRSHLAQAPLVTRGPLEGNPSHGRPQSGCARGLGSAAVLLGQKTFDRNFPFNGRGLFYSQFAFFFFFF